MLCYRLTDNAHGYVGADLMAVVKEASMIALRRSCKDVQRQSGNSGFEIDDSFLLSTDDVREAFQRVRPSGLREVAIDVPKVCIRYIVLSPNALRLRYPTKCIYCTRPTNQIRIKSA